MIAGAAAATGLRPSVEELVALRFAALAASRRPASADRPGAHRSTRLGRGMEFAEARPYVSGDDVRSIDWRQTARRGHPYTKLFHEERERPVLFWVDLSASMGFGTRVALKSVIAARAAALLAWSAAADGDRVGGGVWNGETVTELPPRGRQYGTLALIQALVESSASTTEATAGAAAATLDRLARHLRPGSRIVLLSDFAAFDAAAGRAIAALRRRAAIDLILVYDRLETEAPPPGEYFVSDGRASLCIDTTDPESPASYGREFRARKSGIEALAAKLSAPLLMLATNDDLPARLAGFGRHRPAGA